MTEPSDAFLDDAVSRLARAWSKRSPAERLAFADRLAAASASPARPEGTLRIVRQRAALCGAVVPSDLVLDLDRDEVNRALDLLAPEFDRVHTSGRWTWTLRTGPRRAALRALARNGLLPGRLAEVAGIPTDRAGELLRVLAQQRSTPRDERGSSQGGPGPEDDPATLVQALTWARPLGGFDGDLAEAQRRAAVRSLGQSYGVLTGHGVFGRDEELAQLREFAGKPRETAESGSSPVPLLSLTGIGGAGKSTVLGTFIRPYLDRIERGYPDGPAVVLLDFDRVLFRPTAELELSFELTRQLGYAAPVAAADFSALRYQLSDERRQSGSDRHVSNVRSDSLIREVSAFERHAGKLVELHHLQDRRVLLVLDTFEEWQRERLFPDLAPSSGQTPEERILDWISRIRSVMKLGNCRVIISGRIRLDETGTLLRSADRPHVDIVDLDLAPARELLGVLGVAAPDAETIVRLVGGNPLTLHIAARFYRDLDPAGRREFLAGDPLPAGDLNADIRQAVLYQRFLAHIPDKQVRKLAHPGLLLRRITPELVREVLAGPCGLGDITESEAERLTGKLADEVWLVQQTRNGLYHRRDVRGPMLRLMASDPAHADIVGQIHAAAARWYETRGDGRDRLPWEQAQVEALYHSLMLYPGDEPVAPQDGPERDRWLHFAHELGQSVDELPERTAAQVRVLRGDEVLDQDVGWLPDSVWRRWVEQRGQALVDNGEAIAALDLLTTRSLPVRPEWLAQACSDAGQWSRYHGTARRLGGPTEVDSPASSGRYALLDALLSEDPDDLADYRAALYRYFSRRHAETGTAAPNHAERLFCRLLCDLGLAGHQETTAPHQDVPIAGDQGAIDHFPVDQLRRMTTWIATAPDDTEFVIENAASFGRPDPRWMRDFAAFVGVSDVAAALHSYLTRLGRAVDDGTTGMVTQQLLGEWSIGYERALGPAQIGVRRPQVREAAGLIYVLRGDNPELRPSVQLALADPAAGIGILALADLAEQLLPVAAADLRSPALTESSGSYRRALVQLVEYVDRSGVMREFLAAARRAWPEAALLRRAADAFVVWDDANHRLLDALAAQLQAERD